MKKIYLLSVIVLSFSFLSAQQVLHYDFTNSLSEISGNGPTLTVLGNEGAFVEDTLLEIGSAEKFVYRFEQNSGFQFDNAAAGNFLSEGYTIELYFVFDFLNSWKRVVDWKNRKSDYGAYVYNGELNFYPFEYSGEAPVNPGEYTYYVVTRDAGTEEVLVYTDAEVQISFTDSSGDALLDEDNVLNFFHDDLIVPNEASSGAVAMLKIYNTTLDSTTIKGNYDDLAGNVFSVYEIAIPDNSLRAYPNPAKDILTVELDQFDRGETVHIRLVNDLGKTVRNFELNGGKSNFNFSVESYKPGVYVIQAVTRSKMLTQRILIRN